jgi:integrase
MAPQDLWYKKAGGKKIKSARYGRGKRWRVNYEDPHTGRPQSSSFDTQKEAERFENKIKSAINEGRYVDPKAGHIKVRDYGEQWRITKMFAPATAERVERTLRLHVYPVIGHRDLGTLVRSHIQYWVADRAKVMAPSSLAVAYNTTLVPMLAAAVLDRKIPSSPCVDIDLPKVTGRDYYVATPAQVLALSEALPAEYCAAPLLAAGCGLREGEMLGLEVQHVAFLQRELHVLQQVQYISGRKPYLSLPKNGATGTLDLPGAVADAVAAQMAARPPVAVEIEDETDARKVRFDKATGDRIVPRRTAELLFTHRGRPIYRAEWSRIWRPAVAKVDGLPEGFRLHDLRHLFATSLIHNGASVKTVQVAMRHASPKTTFETYIHEWPDLLDRTRTIMDRVLTLDPPTQDAARTS